MTGNRVSSKDSTLHADEEWNTQTCVLGFKVTTFDGCWTTFFLIIIPAGDGHLAS